eukprot:12429039-Karenia_brevis.AAC.1
MSKTKRSSRLKDRAGHDKVRGSSKSDVWANAAKDARKKRKKHIEEKNPAAPGDLELRQLHIKADESDLYV